MISNDDIAAIWDYWHMSVYSLKDFDRDIVEYELAKTTRCVCPALEHSKPTWIQKGALFPVRPDARWLVDVSVPDTAPTTPPYFVHIKDKRRYEMMQMRGQLDSYEKNCIDERKAPGA